MSISETLTMWVGREDSLGGWLALLIEEIGEKPYAIDRDLTQLGLAGLLRGARVVAVGVGVTWWRRRRRRAAAAAAADSPRPPT